MSGISTGLTVVGVGSAAAGFAAAGLSKLLATSDLPPAGGVVLPVASEGIGASLTYRLCTRSAAQIGHHAASFGIGGAAFVAGQAVGLLV